MDDPSSVDMDNYRTPSRNPLEIKVTLKRILEFVDSDQLDPRNLLRCRLVNKTWNYTTLEVLNDKGTTITVGCDRYPSGVVKKNFYARSKTGANVVRHSYQFLRFTENVAKIKDKEESVIHDQSVLQPLNLRLLKNVSDHVRRFRKTKSNSKGLKADKEARYASASALENLSFDLHLNFLYGKSAFRILRGVCILPAVADHLCSLTLTQNNPIKDESSWPLSACLSVELLSICSSTLQDLKYNIRGKEEWEPEPSAVRVSFQPKWKPITFPKLKSVSLFLEDAVLTPFLIKIVNSAPKLRTFSFLQRAKELEFRVFTSTASIHQIHQNLARLKQHLLPTVSAQIQELKLSLPYHMPRETLLGLEFPGVKKLSLQISTKALDSSFINNFVVRAFPLLKSYECTVVDEPLMPTLGNLWWLGRNSPDEEPFPNLTDLEHFGLTLSDCRGQKLNGKNHSFNTEKRSVIEFLDAVALNSSIRSVTLDLATALELSSSRIVIQELGEIPLYDDLVFPNATHLQLNGDTDTDDGGKEAAGYLETMLTYIFPALTDITLHLERNIYEEASSPFTMKNYLSGILQLEGIRHLVLIMYHKRWLLDALASPSLASVPTGLLSRYFRCLRRRRTSDDNPSPISSTVEHLELRQPREHWNNKLEPFRAADLRTILAKFPRLQVLGVDIRMFRDSGAEQNDIWKQLGQIKQEYPNVDIQFL